MDECRREKVRGQDDRRHYRIRAVHLEAARAEAERANATVKFIGDGVGAETTVRAPMTGVVLAVKATVGYRF